jgi:hypothetical protein
MFFDRADKQSSSDKKIFFWLTQDAVRMVDQRQFLTQKDRNRHSQSDKFRLVTADVVQTDLSGMNAQCVLKSRKTQS